MELAWREIQERYVGQVLGVLWALGHPILIILLYAFLFSFVFQMRTETGLESVSSYTAYILAGIVPWLVFQEVLGKSSTLILNNANMIKQVVFPREVFPLKTVLASLVSLLLLLVLVGIYAVATRGNIGLIYCLLFVLVVFQALAMAGACMLLSAVGVFFRDLKDFVQIFLALAMFLMPILYLPSALPSFLRPLIYLNPFSHMIWCYQDVLCFGSFRHPWSWAVFGLGSLTIFVLGHRIFRRLSSMFGDVL